VDDALATRLRWALHGARVRLHDLPLHGHGAGVHVDVTDAEGHQLTEAQRGPEGQVDEAPEVLGHVRGEVLHLVDVQQRSLVTAGLAAPLIRQGFRGSASSATAVARMAWRRA
jgi:hypothetical protein